MGKRWILIVISLSSVFWGGAVRAQENGGEEFKYPNPAFWAEQCLFLGGQKLYAEALKACERAIALAPEEENRELWQARSYSLFQLERYAEAVVSYNQFLRLSPEDSLAWTNQCIALYRLERYDSAIASCQQALSTNGNWGIGSPVLAWYHRGRTLQALGGQQPTQEGALNYYQQAVESYDRALELAPNDSLAAAGRCELLSVLEAGGGCNIETAIAAYETAAARSPQDVDLWKNQAIALERLGRDEKALESYMRALAIRPTYSLLLVQQCAVLNRLGQYQEALKACEAAIAGDGVWGDRNPAYAWSQNSRAQIGLGQYEAALAAAERATTIDPNYSEGWNNRGVSLWYLNRLEEALAVTERAIALVPDSAIALFNRGRILSSLQRYADAIASYDSAIAAYDVRPTDPLSCQNLKPDVKDIRQDAREMCASLWNQKGVAHLRLKEYPLAKTSLQMAAAILPDFFEAWYNLGIALASANENEAALEAYARADRLRPNQLDILLARGAILEKLERYEDAIALYDAILAIAPQSTAARQGRARVSEIWLQRKLKPPSPPQTPPP
ncbi:tetratricopeptide repeat protein [Oscillatoria sp. FACHB-1406]|uniref:tetratricopeptide repeat protein n=1 Tax=Oscillatoria sp. FACHB-1406 TaxID=2692846 RepID=UPI0016852B0D|nr:tetratricopeptide repeat protein [Oscillatoria sp. FACHB-1406]MBD2576486.1 tetratricopeptide repeat protein [Oscillatoria sp. FACHB-1406]